MKSADELFEELGYKKIEENLSIYALCKYKKDDDNIIRFDKDFEIHKTGEYSESYYGITMQELKAINKKCSEMGWL